jgi:uncharacterized protein YceK
MASNAGCWKRRLAVLAIITSVLIGCATLGSDGKPPGASPPLVEYSREFQARAAEKLAVLPENSAIMDMPGDHAVLREQARACA